MDNFKSGFITIIGRPNAGKSTLINQILKQKIAIISDKPQTTRNQIQGVLTTSDTQMVFIDTPGIHKPHNKLGEFMNNIALRAINQVDVILFMVNGVDEIGGGERFIIEHLKSVKQPVFLLLNKIDLMKKDAIYHRIEEYSKEFSFTEIIPVSALKNDNIDHLLNVIKGYLEEGPKYYPEDTITSSPENFIISELIREKVLYKTREEVPHSVAVIIEQITPREDSSVIDVLAAIIVEKDSQKPIIIGKGGQMLKEIGSLARKEIQDLLGSKVYLELWVKVIPDWRNRKGQLTQLGYSESLY